MHTGDADVCGSHVLLPTLSTHTRNTLSCAWCVHYFWPNIFKISSIHQLQVFFPCKIHWLGRDKTHSHSHLLDKCRRRKVAFFSYFCTMVHIMLFNRLPGLFLMNGEQPASKARKQSISCFLKLPNRPDGGETVRRLIFSRSKKCLYIMHESIRHLFGSFWQLLHVCRSVDWRRCVCEPASGSELLSCGAQ